MDEAIALAHRANAVAPGDPDYYRVVAFYAQHKGDADGFRRAAEAMLRLNPKKPNGYNVLAISYLLRAMAYALDGDDARARAEAKEVRRLDPGFKVGIEQLRADAGTPFQKSFTEGKEIRALRRAGLLE
jgi:hypothetical protein